MTSAAHRSIWTDLYATAHRLDYVVSGGVRTRYLESGAPDAPPVLLLHGTAGSLENFCANIAEYSRHFRVIAIDMLGCGLTDKPDHDYKIADYAKHALAVMDALALKRAAIVGVSLGSWVAAAMATMAPDRVEKIVMAAPAGIIVDAEEERKVAEGVRARRSAAAIDPTWESISKAMRGLVLDPATLTDDIIALRLAIYSDPRMKAAMSRLLAFSLGGQHLSEDQWRALSCPILTIASVDAPSMFLKNAYAIAKIAPRARVVEMRGCDHWPQCEQPDEFNRLSVEFLKA